jgi:serine protease
MDFSAQRDTVFQNLNIKKRIRSHAPPANAPSRFIPSKGKSADAQSKYETLQVIKALRARSDVEHVDVNYVRQSMALPSGNEYYSELWSYGLIGMDSVWTGTSITGSGSIVAVIDTGNRLTHPDMIGQFVSGYDFISDATRARDGDGIDADPSDPGDNPGSSSFHGTHVAGTIAAVNNSIGIVGIAYGAKIMPLRALGQGGGTDVDIMQAMLFAAGLSNDSCTVPAQKADVINMSLGGPGSSSTFQTVVTDVRNAGVIIIAAAGNENTSTPSYPASYDGVVSVSAVAQDETRAYYSNYGSAVDVAAPGGDGSKDTMIYSTIASDSTGSIVDGYTYYQGTSMATPHVAAVAALMKEANPSMTPADFDAYLSSGDITDDLGTAGRDDIYGYGLINAAKAVSVAGTPIPAYFLVDPTSLVYVSSVSSKTITVSNGGTEAFTAAATTSISYTSGSGWLSITPTSVDGTNLGSYQLDVDRTGLANGEYQATVTFSAPGSSPAISDYVLNVTLRVGLDIGVDAGYQYIIIEDADTGTRVGSMEAVPVNGQYQYTFTGVPAGNYYLYAGTDMDNSFYFCDTGEACGTYSSTPIAVSGDMSGLDFITKFDIPTGAAKVGSSK